MFSRSNFRDVKTTLLGFLLVAASVAYVFLIENISLWVFGGLIVLGVCLMFLPNKLFESLGKLLNANSEKKF